MYDRIINKNLLIRRLNITANHIINEDAVPKTQEQYEQLDIFTDYAARKVRREKEEQELKRERSVQETLLKIKKKYGKNSILKGISMEEGATTKDRNQQIGGHKA